MKYEKKATGDFLPQFSHPIIISTLLGVDHSRITPGTLGVDNQG